MKAARGKVKRTPCVNERTFDTRERVRRHDMVFRYAPQLNAATRVKMTVDGRV